jgi:hypothetical protein
MEQDFEVRLSRLEAIEEIRTLPSRYALAADSRDIDALVDLYADVNRPVYFPMGSEGITRDDLGGWIRSSLDQYGTTQHFICNHLVDLDDESHGHGIVYCQAGQERGHNWILLALMYEDRYVVDGGRWRFAERHALPWYYTDWNDKPTGPEKMRWPDRPHTRAPLPDHWPTWRAFAPSGDA